MREGSDEKKDWEKEKLNNGWSVPKSHSSTQFNVVRRVYLQDTLNRDADYQQPKKPLSHQLLKLMRICGYQDCLCNSCPIIKWLPKYKYKEALVSDLIAGATTAVMHIPQGMAYALLAEVPAIVGLYMAFFPVLIYVLLGTSPHISMGTFAVACLMAGKVVTQWTAPIVNASLNATIAQNATTAVASAYSPMQIVSVVCFTVGLFQMIMWALRLGAVSTLLSEPLVSGFTTAASFQVLASQLKDLFGIHLPKHSGNYKVIQTLYDLATMITKTNIAALVISIFTCLVVTINNEILKPKVAKRSRVPIPIELLAVVTGTLVSKYAKLDELFNIVLVGSIPTGLPIPEVPPVEMIPSVALDAFTITMVTYTISMSMAFIFASREKYEVDGNQELLALGASNLFASFFGCIPFCASLSRSYIQYQAGAKTQLTSFVSAMLILCVLLWIGPFFENLPRSVLASIIVVSLKGMFMQVKELSKFWKLSKLDALVWLVTFLTTLLINIDIGLGAGLLASVGTLFSRSQRPYTCLLGRVLNTDIYLDIKRYRAAEEIPGVKIFHYCGGLNFATKHMFQEILFRKVGYKKPVQPETDEDNNMDAAKSDSYEWDPTIANRVHCVIIDATALSYVDGPGIKTLVAAQKELDNNDILVLMAGANGPVLEMIDRYNSLEPEELHLVTFPTVHDAVVYYKILESKKPLITPVGVTITS
ncbi:solute carrier family 26 member 10 isoform X2 [Pectinophora gossypiella]|uniref:solute carrier family 26 member 10 isoform X2 n=1 Tax=Pectinophora gossypiella TaxID=13191 RepID=UPI00214EC7F2|nr:solute carrier family 26 member 10 isoform X2 [Pectinophora gossypiella]XP_049879426.1 solute carrier family 26 member 10 isoform X2 [Pectinophora gossypiella]XP_049879427.1 solute carrier family 26 member 10 isoform X2 [Pectinophora gossypiella]